MRSALPTIQGVIDRRALVNFRIDPEPLTTILPPQMQPQLVSGWAIGGICLIRLRDIRPKGFPAFMGLRSENAAHRIAVEWDQGSERRTGVFIPRRDSSSFVNTLLGGRVFPGHHHRADFRIEEIGDRVSISMTSRDDDGRVSVRGRLGEGMPSESVFDSLAQVTTFFRKDAIGFSPDREGRLEGLELETLGWSVEPLDVEHVTTSFFEDAVRFPAGSVVFDNALLMRNVGHRWHALAGLYDW